jgi:tRNA A-37 threonylcarbamoyl transferase component Bud32
MSGGLPSDAPTLKMTPSQKPGGSSVPATPSPSELAPHFPQLEIVELLGCGGMGMVYKARQKNLNRFVALKILAVQPDADEQFAERFQREAQALARLNHPNIVTVYEVGQTEGLFYFLMEFVDGANLRTLIRDSAMKPEAALALIPSFCDALQYAHDEGVVHRDIKPENVLVDKKGRVKIADFGLAKLLGHEATDHTLTRTGMHLGTPRYMAPEQMDKPETVDHRADIYSLGVVFYEMLTGEVPMGRFEPPSKKVQIDVKLDEIVLHAMERDVERRYQHASEIKTAVQSVTSTAAMAAAAPHPNSSPPAAGNAWSAWIWWAALVLTLLPFAFLVQRGRASILADPGPIAYGYGPPSFGIWPLVLLALAAFAVIRLLELRETRAGATPRMPFSQAWLGVIVAIFGVCLFTIGPFPFAEWQREVLEVRPTKVANTAGTQVKLPGFSQTRLKHGYEFWQGQAIALVSVLTTAFLLLGPRKVRWNAASSVLLVGAGVTIAVVTLRFGFDRPTGSLLSMEVIELRAKTDPWMRRFGDNYNRHITEQAEEKNVGMETIKRSTYTVAALEFRYANGSMFAFLAGMTLSAIGVLQLRRTMNSSPAAFDGWHRGWTAWGSLLLLVPCVATVLPAFNFYWAVDVVFVPLPKSVWTGDFLDWNRVHLGGVHFWQGKVIVAACLAAVLVVAATALLRWRYGMRAAALGLAGLASIVCVIDYMKGDFSSEEATLSWDDFRAVAQRGATAAGSDETRRFLADYPHYVGQLMELDKAAQALTAKHTVPFPNEELKVTVTKSADGKQTTTTTEYPVPGIKEERLAQLKWLVDGDGMAKTSRFFVRDSPQWTLFCGLGLVLLGIRDGYRAWKNRREGRTAEV